MVTNSYAAKTAYRHFALCHSPSLSPSYQPLGLLLLGIAAEVHHIGGLLILAGPLLRPFLACADCSIGYIMREYEADLRPQM